MLIIVPQEITVKDFNHYEKHEVIDTVSTIFDYCYHTISMLQNYDFKAYLAG